jgi:uncharacterized protein YuzE
MRVRYDKEADALEIRLSDEPVSRRVEVDAGTAVDLDSGEAVVAIEVVHPGRRWPVDAVIEFGFDPFAAEVLRSLWIARGTYAFAEPAEASVEAPAGGTLARA